MSPRHVGTAGRFDAIILAGSRGPSDPVATARGVAAKCLAPVNGVPMLSRVVAALTSQSWIEHIRVVAEPTAGVEQLPDIARLIEAGRASLVPAATSPSLSVKAALNAGGRYPVLVTTADHALLNNTILGAFHAQATTINADAAVGIASQSAVQVTYPDTRRTFWRFRDGGWSGANLFALLTPAAEQAVRYWRQVEESRKRPWRIAAAFGLSNLAAYLTGRLSLNEAMERASAVMGCHVQAIRLDIAEAAIDVDSAEDLALVERILDHRLEHRRGR